VAARPRPHLTPTVLLHGFTGSAAAWEPVLEGLRAAGRRPVAIDLPGHGARVGEVDPPAFALASTLADVGDAAPGRADVVGYSMGGRIALHFAAAFPSRVRSLVLESASPGLATGTERSARRAADEALARSIEEGGVEAFVERWAALPLFATRARLDAATRARLRARSRANQPASLAAALRGLGTGALPSLWNGLERIEAPTLLLVGAEDAKFVGIAARMVERLPNARLSVVPSAGHTVHLEQPEAWLGEVLDFLASGSG
jgi:2-succinyl-6-hydroxy-2,4-cyclohexadiene-1-carboxylate synthase